MRVRLWVKLFIGFLAVIVLFGMMLTFIARRVLEQQFTRYVEENDIRLSQQIAGLLSDEITLAHGSRRISEQQFFHMLSEEPAVPPMRHMREAPSDSFPLFSMMMHHRRGMPQSIAVTDTQGNIRRVYGSVSETGPIRTEGGIPVLSGDRTVGYVFAGTMIDSGLDAYHREMLASIDQSIITAALIAFAVSLVISLLMFAHIISPVSALRRAAESIGRGRYQTRVRINRRDELGDLSRSFNSMAESLEQSEIWKRRIISDAAHELRTPAALLSAEIEMLLDGVYSPDKDQLTHMQHEVQQLSQLIDELQYLSSMESGTVSLLLEECSLQELIAQAVSAFTLLADRKQIEITRQQSLGPGHLGAGDDLRVSWDSRRMEQVFSNILANALRHTPEGGSIDVTCARSSENTLVISIEDSGPGIAEEEREKIFERFYRVEMHRGRESGGAGLGLAITREILHLHGASVRAAAPAVFGGARIEIEFPAHVVKN